MARSHARLLTGIWTDRDFVALPDRAQLLYMRMLSQPNLSYCGVVPFTAKRWAGLSADGNAKALEKALTELEAARFVVWDQDTEEVLIRSFIRHDGVLKSPNICVAMVKDYCATMSPALREAIAEEIPKPFPAPLRKGFPEGFPQPFDKEVAKGSHACTPAPSPLDLPPPPRPTPSPAAAADPLPPDPQAPPDLPAPPAGPEASNGSAAALNSSSVAHVTAVLMRTRKKHEAAIRADNPPGWLIAAERGIRGEVLTALPRLVAEHPDWTFEQWAAAIDGKPIPAAGPDRPPAPTVCDDCADHPGIRATDDPNTFDVCGHEPLRQAS